MNLIKKSIREAIKTPGFSLLYMAGVAFTVAFTIIYGMLLYRPVSYTHLRAPETIGKLGCRRLDA